MIQVGPHMLSDDFEIASRQAKGVKRLLMKTSLRILVGILGLAAIFFGIKQIIRGTKELSGQPITQTQKLGETFTSTENGYSHRIPQGWEKKPPPQAGVTMIAAPAASGFSSNMVTTVEQFDGSLRAYADANLKSLQANLPDAKLVSDHEFVPDNKASSYKLTFTNKMNKVDLAQALYLFEGKQGKKIIITCTASAKQGPELEPLFDDCMKTFTLTAQ